MDNYSISSFLLLMLLLQPIHTHAKPGNEFVLKETETRATLYLIEVHQNPAQSKFAYRFLWIPDDIASRCLGKAPTYCKNLDNCFLYPDAQECNADWSSCEKIIRPTCIPFGFTLENLSTRQRQPPPNVLLDTLYYSESATLMPSVKAMGISDFSESKLSFDTIDVRHAVKARVHWEQWTNGENFKILEFID